VATAAGFALTVRVELLVVVFAGAMSTGSIVASGALMLSTVGAGAALTAGSAGAGCVAVVVGWAGACCPSACVEESARAAAIAGRALVRA
jgi:hypothetical protein